MSRTDKSDVMEVPLSSSSPGLNSTRKYKACRDTADAPRDSVLASISWNVPAPIIVLPSTPARPTKQRHSTKKHEPRGHIAPEHRFRDSKPVRSAGGQRRLRLYAGDFMAKVLDMAESQESNLRKAFFAMSLVICLSYRCCLSNP